MRQISSAGSIMLQEMKRQRLCVAKELMGDVEEKGMDPARRSFCVGEVGATWTDKQLHSPLT